MVGRQRGRTAPLVGDPRVEPVLTIWFACQIKLTFGRRAIATAPTFRLRRAGSKGRNHFFLGGFKPFNPSVWPPGSAEADRSSADELSFLRREADLRRSSSRLPRSRRRKSRT